MTSNESIADAGRPGYRIGAVVRLTGLSPHVLRVWEKRYGVIQPDRTANRRRVYSEADIEKLTLLKTLVDRGQAIGTLAQLDLAELKRRVGHSAATAAPGAVIRPQLVLVGENLHVQAQTWRRSETYELVGTYRSTADLRAAPHTRRLDVAVVEWPTLHPESAIEADRLASRLNLRQLVLVYHYASQPSLRRLESSRITAIRAPLEEAALAGFIAGRFGGHAPAVDTQHHGRRAPRYDERQLAHIGKQAAALGCECPGHLSDLITRLGRFEAYSAECESRNEQDAALHHHLHAMTAQARDLMESALARVIEVEGLGTDPSD